MSVERVCAREECGQVFHRPFESRRGKYCSVTCAGAARSDAAAAARVDPVEVAEMAARQSWRAERWWPFLAAGAHSVRVRDRHGVQVLWERAVRDGDLASLFTAALGRIAELEDALTGEKESEGEAA